MKINTLGKQSHDHTDEEGSGDVDDESADGESSSIPRHDGCSGDVSDKRTGAAAEEDDQEAIQREL